MTVLASLLMEAATSSPPAGDSAILEIEAGIDGAVDLLMEAALDVDLADQLAPTRADATQVVYGRVTVALPGKTVELWPASLNSWTVTRTRGGSTWSFSLPATDSAGVSALGLAASWGTAVPGNSSIDVDLVHEVPSGALTTYRQIHDGRAMVSSEEYGAGGHLQRIEGMDRLGRYDKCTVEYHLDPRHGKPQGTIIAELAALAEFPDVAIGANIGEPRLNPLDLSCTKWLPTAREAARSKGRAIVVAPDGTLEAPEILTGGPAEWTFGISDIVGTGLSAVRSSIRGDGPTCITIRGSVVEQDGGDGSDGVGSTTTETVTEISGPYAVKGAYWVTTFTTPAPWDKPLTPIPNPGPLPTKDILVRRITHRVTKVRGCVQRESTVIEEWFSPSAARYQINDEGDPEFVLISGYLYNADAVGGDQSPAFIWKTERFVVTQEVLKVNTWGEDGEGGVLTKRETFYGGWLSPRVALKQRARPFVDWDDVPFMEVKTDAEGNGVKFTSELSLFGPQGIGGPYQTVSRRSLAPGGPSNNWKSIDVERFVDAEGYLSSESVERHRWGRDGQFTWLYSDGETSGTGEDRDIVESSERKDYQETGESTHQETTQKLDVGGKLIAEGLIVTQKVGAGPATPDCRAKDIDRVSSKPVAGKACRPGKACGDSIEKSSRFVESDIEAHDLARLEMILSGPLVVNFQALPSGVLRPFMPVELHIPGAGLSHRRGVIDKITTGQAPRGAGGGVQPILSSIEVHISPLDE